MDELPEVAALGRVEEGIWGTSLAAWRIGSPQWGQALALRETLPPQTGQEVKRVEVGEGSIIYKPILKRKIR